MEEKADMSKRKKGGSGTIIALVAGGVALLALIIYGAVMSTQQAEQQKKVAEMTKPDPAAGCTHEPAKLNVPGIEVVSCKSAAHVNDGQKVNYETNPPTSGAHWATPTNPGFYTAAQTPERLVHSLEHGNVVIYYNQASLQSSDVDALKAVAKQYTGQWDGVVVVPWTGKEAAVLTAWETTLRLDKYDPAKVDQFVDAFRGRGPEHPVRPLQ
jgi:hypothetical protein